MRKYSIKDIEKLTDIKAHTLRVWEQRYNFLVPHRTPTNIRYYDADQLKVLLNVSLLVNNGSRISKVCTLTEEELNEEVKKAFELNAEDITDRSVQFKINGLVLAMLDLDEAKFNEIFLRSLTKRGMERTLTDIIEPFLERIQILWRTGEVLTAFERYMHNLIRQKIIVAFDALREPKQPSEKYLVFLPEQEFNDIYTLLYTYILKAHGRQIVNLGSNIPITDLVQIVQLTNPDVILTFFNDPIGLSHIQDYANRLSEAFVHKRILIAGNATGIENLALNNNASAVQSLDEFTDMLENS